MKLKVIALVTLALWAAISPFAQAISMKSTPEGQELAAELRNTGPAKESEISGVLKMESPKGHTEIPVVAKVVVNDGKWITTYTTSPVGNIAAQQIVVVHSLNAPNQYLVARAPSPKAPLPEPTPISSQAAAETFLAGSDFTVADLGLDFLHWADQNRLTGELRLGRDCYLLQSESPTSREMVRVKSWVDKESKGLLVAEGFNAKSEKVKVFSLSGSSFKKVNGQMQLEKMTIRSPKKKSETVLEFNLPKD